VDLTARSAERGAYGLRLEQVDDASATLGAALPEWPALRIERRLGRLPDVAETVDDERARFRLRDGGAIEVARTAATATFTLPRPVGADELVHPLLAPAASAVAHWEGRESFHAGAFVLEGRAWGVIGGRGTGKSTTMAQLALGGVPVLSDDLLVVDRGNALAGPRCVDLREEAATALSVGDALGIVGSRARWRVQLDTVDLVVPLAGWVFLAWGDRLERVPLPASARLRRLHAERALRVPPRDPAALVELTALPGWELRRPRGLHSLERSAELLRGLAD
jgi:hypothetical protein